MISDLRARLDRYPADAKPLQRGAVLLELGAALLAEDQFAEAADALGDAGQLLAGARPEHARALFLGGVALRGAGRAEEAIAAFEAARDAYGELAQPADEAAARFNLGVTLRQTGRAEAADELAAAREAFVGLGHRAGAASAQRELAQLRLLDGDPASARALLEEAADELAAAGDAAGVADAVNALGLACLAVADIDGATSAFERARALAPPSVRASQHATAAANLALAYERGGRDAAARTTARQVVALAGAPPAARIQAAAVLERLAADGTDEGDDLLVVLDETPAEDRSAVLRAELDRVCRLPAPDAASALAALARRLGDADLAEAVLAIIVEQPPEAAARVLGACLTVVAADPDQDAEAIARGLSRAVARFPVPQMMRLQGLLADLGRDVGLDRRW